MSDPVSAPRLDTLAGRYRIDDRLGRGSTSVVYRGFDLAAGHPVALKMLDARLTWDPRALERLRREVIVSRQVRHPGIVRVHELVVDGGRAAVVQELVEGGSIAALVEHEGALAVARAIRLAEGVLEALAACHKQRIVHRDVKPSNVLVEAGDRIRLIDFGIARVSLLTTVTHTGAVLGTPESQAPEILRGERPDLRCDLYGVGLLLFQMLAGRPPFPRHSPERPIFGQLDEEPPDVAASRRDLPAGLAVLIRRLLDPHPEMRPEDAIEVIEALHEIGGEVSPSAPAPGCSECGHRNRSASLSFCAGCGRHERLVLRAGTWSVRLKEVDRGDEYLQHLQQMCGAHLQAARLRDHLQRADSTVVLARGLSEKSARALAVDASRFGGSSEAHVPRLGREVVVVAGHTLLIVTAFAIVMALMGLTNLAASLSEGGSSVPAIAKACFGLAGLATLGILGYVVHSSRPIIDQRALGTGGTQDRADYVASKLAARVSPLRVGPLREPLAAAIEAYCETKRKLPKASGSEALAPLLDQILDRAFLVAERGASLARLLEARSPADASRELDQVRARMRSARHTTSELAALDSALEAEIQALEAADDLVSAAAGRLALAAGVFKRTTRALRARSAPDQTALREFLSESDLDSAALTGAVERMNLPRVQA